MGLKEVLKKPSSLSCTGPKAIALSGFFFYILYLLERCYSKVIYAFPCNDHTAFHACFSTLSLNKSLDL